VSLSLLTWRVGRRVTRRTADLLARLAAPVINLRPPAPVRAWERTILQATGQAPTRRQRRLMLENWLRNTLWSLGLAGWSAQDIVDSVVITDRDAEKLRSSAAGPGLVVALPHMGSWDCAGAWAARTGLPVVSVAERLPDGLYERFRDARAAMGITVYPVDEPEVLDRLAEDVHAGRLVCLVSDRALSSHGVTVDWPGGDQVRITVPAGPALLALRTGAHLRAATTRFEGRRLRIDVSDPIEGTEVTELLHGVVAHFASAIRESPENWLMLRKALR